MKRILSITLVALSLTAGYNAKAQAFNRETREITLSVGASDIFHIPNGYVFYNHFYSPITGQFGIEGEFAIHKYVGLGFTIGLGGRGGGYVYGPGGYYSGYYPEVNLAVGMIANFHFYQLIADKSSHGDRLHADKLDIYAGLNIGSGAAFHPGYIDQFGRQAVAIDVLFFAGPQVGLHYFFVPRVGLNAEFGFGKSLARVGFTFKLNK